ncbi:hypothetical protein C8R46DRAFT_1163071 [Mycena filopes]|nr:hypothetical protein C8R46DRAFT_1163071 [Mycena filopes]
MSFLTFEDSSFDEQQQFLRSPEEPMIFDFDDYVPGYDYTGRMPEELDIKPIFPIQPQTPVYINPAYSPFDSEGYFQEDSKNPPSLYLQSWFTREASSSDNNTSPLPSPSSPIPIPSAGPQSPSFIAFGEHSSPFAQSFSPASLAAAIALPSSGSPSSSSFEDHHHSHYAAAPRQLDSMSVSPHETQTPAWAAQLWETTPRHLRTPSSPRSSARHSPLGGVRIPAPSPRRNSLSAGQLFPSSSAPSVAPPLGGGHNTIRAYSRRAESFGAADDRDATVRRKKRATAGPEDGGRAEAAESSTSTSKMQHDSPPMKSMLRPPKLAPSAWQLYFTDWIQRQQASSSRKLNVAQAAKEAGQEYASLSEEEKEPYKRRSQAAKDIRERELHAYMRTLTPDDIKRENAFRAAQRKAGKSRKSNIKDPNAPKKPLSAYFMFLQRIRASRELVRETTRQSVLAAARWRAMTDEERRPFLAQAEQEKMEYEAARRLYEDGAMPYGTSINFSILPGSPAFSAAIKIESESEGEGEGFFHRHLQPHVRSL